MFMRHLRRADGWLRFADCVRLGGRRGLEDGPAGPLVGLPSAFGHADPFGRHKPDGDRPSRVSCRLCLARLALCNHAVASVTPGRNQGMKLGDVPCRARPLGEPVGALDAPEVLARPVHRGYVAHHIRVLCKGLEAVGAREVPCSHVRQAPVRLQVRLSSKCPLAVSAREGSLEAVGRSNVRLEGRPVAKGFSALVALKVPLLPVDHPHVLPQRRGGGQRLATLGAHVPNTQVAAHRSRPSP